MPHRAERKMVLTSGQLEPENSGLHLTPAVPEMVARSSKWADPAFSAVVLGGGVSLLVIVGL
jgi:hypothetical protein